MRAHSELPAKGLAGDMDPPWIELRQFVDQQVTSFQPMTRVAAFDPNAQQGERLALQAQRALW